MLESLFNKNRSVLQACNFIKKRVEHRCFPVNILRIAFYIEHLWLLLLSKNLTALHFGFPIFMHGSPAENLAAEHLGFSDFMHDSPAENQTTVHLGFQISCTAAVHAGMACDLV